MLEYYLPQMIQCLTDSEVAGIVSFFRFPDNILLQSKLKCLIMTLYTGSEPQMGDGHILRKRIECQLELDHVSRETGISTKLIRAIEQSNKKPFSSVLSYKMTEQKLDNYYAVQSNMSRKEKNIPSFLRTKIGG